MEFCMKVTRQAGLVTAIVFMLDNLLRSSGCFQAFLGGSYASDVGRWFCCHI